MKKHIIILLIIILVIGGFSVIFGLLSNYKNFDNRKKFVFWSIQLKPIYEKEINNIIADFEKKHPDYKVVWVDIPIQEAQKRTLASILSSTPPDLINLNPDFSAILAQKNTLEYFSESETKQYNKSLLEKLKYNGNIYALPFYATSPVTIYNKNIYNKCAGTEFIKSYEDLYNISQKIKKCSGIAPFAINLNENDTLAKILNKYNINDFKTEKQKDSAVKIYKLFNDMYKNDYLPKDVLSINHREVIEKYMSNQAVIIVAGSNFINMIKQNAKDIYDISALSKQLTGQNGKYDVALMNLVIPKKSKNIDIAKDFAFVLTNKENQLKLSKLTNVLPANQYALNDNYFKECKEDLIEQARCISASQLNNLNTVSFGEKNKKTINETVNKTLEEIILNNADIQNKINFLSENIKILMTK